MKNLLITLGCIFLLGMNGYAIKYSALKSGEWDENGVWPAGHPSDGDTLEIPVGITVKFSKKLTIPGNSIYLTVYGVLSFKNGVKVVFPACSKIFIATGGALQDGGGGGRDQRITIGGTDVWTAACNCGSCHPINCDFINGPRLLSACVLPTNITYFNASKENNEIEFKWATENNEYFLFNIDVSEDGKAWKNFRTILGGHQNYSFKTECNTSAYYRLGGQKPEASIDYLNPLYVVCGDQKYILNQEAKTLKAIDATSIQILDFNGKSILESNQNEISLLGLKEGIYILILKTPDKIYKSKVSINWN